MIENLMEALINRGKVRDDPAFLVYFIRKYLISSNVQMQKFADLLVRHEVI